MPIRKVDMKPSRNVVQTSERLQTVEWCNSYVAIVKKIETRVPHSLGTNTTLYIAKLASP